MQFDLMLGRWMALSLHPHRAWRVLPVSSRLLLVGTYFGGAYLTTLVLLLI